MGTEQETDSDFQLLRRYASDGDELAFQRLVERHAPLVRGVSRRCLGDAGLADEVTQSVFSLLARRAATVPAEYLGGWLYQTAFLTAQNARRAADRYKNALREASRENSFMDASETNSSGAGPQWQDVVPYLDEVVASLSEKVRRPVIMRYFEDRSIGEIAALTGKSDAAIRKAIERALKRLSAMLGRRGITITSGTLGMMLAGQCLLAPPTSAAALTGAALHGSSAVNAVAATSTTSTIFSNAIILMTTIKATALTSAAVILAAIPAVVFWRQNSALKAEVNELRSVATTRTAPAVPALTPSKPIIPFSGGGGDLKPKGTTNVPKDPAADLLAMLFAPEAILKRAEEDAVKNAVRDMERISLFLPELTEEKKEQVRDALERRNNAKLAQLKVAFESGAFDRVINHPEKATAADKALMAEAAPAGPPSREDDPLATILSTNQFETYWQKQEQKRVSDAEAGAADALKFLNEGLDLSTEQKDRIFQELAQVQLAPIEGGEGPSNSFLDQRIREEEKQRILREQLTPEQVALVEKRLGEFKQGIEKLFKQAGGAAAVK